MEHEEGFHINASTTAADRLTSTGARELTRRLTHAQFGRVAFGSIPNVLKVAGMQRGCCSVLAPASQ